MRKIADLYAEVIGVLSQARFHSVRCRFFQEIKNPMHHSATIISVIEGMSFIRVKMFPVEELEQWFAFLQVRKYSNTCTYVNITSMYSNMYMYMQAFIPCFVQSYTCSNYNSALHLDCILNLMSCVLITQSS